MKFPHIPIKFKKPGIHRAKLLQAFKKGKQKTAWGLDIGGHALKAVKIVKISDSVFVDDIDIIEYPTVSSGINLLQSIHIKDAIRAFLLKHQIHKVHNIHVSVPGHLILSRFTTIPPVSKKQLKAVIQYEAKQQIPFNFDEIVWDFQQLSDLDPHGEGIEIGLFAAKRVTLDNILANIISLKYQIKTLQISPLAIYNFVLFDQQVDGPAIIINAETENTDMIVIDGQRLWLRSIPLSLINTDLVKEIQRSVEYYKSLTKDAVVFKTIVLVGNAFKNPLNGKMLSDSFVPGVKVIDTLHNIKLSDKIDPDFFNGNLMNLTVALGLALQGIGYGHIKTNVLPQELFKAAEISRKKPYAIAALVCFALSLIVQYYGSHTRIKYFDNSYKYHQRKLQDVREFERNYKIAETQAQANKSALNVISSIDSSRFFWMETLDRLLPLIPYNVSITSIRSSWVDENTLKSEGVPKQTEPKFFQNQRRTPAPKKSVPPRKLLLMEMKGESRDPRMGFVGEHILKPIQGLTLFDQNIPAFRNVEIVPGSSYQVGQKDEPGSYIAFEIRWLVKTPDEIRTEIESLSKR